MKILLDVDFAKEEGSWHGGRVSMCKEVLAYIKWATDDGFDADVVLDVVESILEDEREKSRNYCRALGYARRYKEEQDAATQNSA